MRHKISKTKHDNSNQRNPSEIDLGKSSKRILVKYWKLKFVNFVTALITIRKQNRPGADSRLKCAAPKVQDRQKWRQKTRLVLGGDRADTP